MRGAYMEKVEILFNQVDDAIAVMKNGETACAFK